VNKKDAVAFLGHCGVPPSKVILTKDWVRAPCPLAPWTHDSGRDTNPSFGIKIADNKESIFNCFTCRSGDCTLLVQLLSEYGAQSPKFNLAKAMVIIANEDDGMVHAEANAFVEPDDLPALQEEIMVWPHDWLNSFDMVHKVTRACTYLEARNVSPLTASLLGLRYDSTLDCVCFPVYDKTSDLVGMRGRRIAPKDNEPKYNMYKYKGHYSNLPWYGEVWFDDERPVLMVESVFDVASAIRVYDNVCAPLTVGMSKDKVRRMAGAQEIVTLFDNGKGGDKARSIITKYLPDVSRITHLCPPPHVSDPGDMNVQELGEALSPHLALFS